MQIRKDISGFTTLELIMTILLMAIVAKGVFISWPATTINLGATADQLSDDIRYTQSLSMCKNQRFELIKTGANTYQIKTTAGTVATLANGKTTITLASGVTFGTLTNLPNSLIAFDTQGYPYVDTGSPGTLLAATATIPVTAGGQTKTVSINQTTGYVSVS